ncbi:MAG: Transcriptional regulator, ArsR family [Methanothrix harundinacea]|uniref:Transcriptional regulator, ArsR family n=2 Tax=Methanothrix harundinacea TaxID=301375 RepID=A0A101FS95_9EURY|nr:MAG: Transcriptional regulator, ArsR family [Methanothrix harundinacea]
MNRTATDWRVRILSALSDPTRLDIIEFLGKEERCVCEIVPAFGRAQSTISKHLAVLFEAGILERRIDGKRTLYRVKNPMLFDLLREVDALALEEISELKEAFWGWVAASSWFPSRYGCSRLLECLWTSL